MYPAHTMNIPLEHALPFQNWWTLQAHINHTMPTARDRVSAFTGRYIADVHHSMNSAMGCPLIPTLVTHGKVVDCKDMKMLTGLPHLAAVGEPVTDEVRSPLFPQIFDFSGLLHSEQKKLAGNSIHMEVLGVLTMYTLANIEIVSDVWPRAGDASSNSSGL